MDNYFLKPNFYDFYDELLFKYYGDRHVVWDEAGDKDFSVISYTWKGNIYIYQIGESEFLHTSPKRAGFYRNKSCAMAEALVIKHNAANGPKRPEQSAKDTRARIDRINSEDV